MLGVCLSAWRAEGAESALSAAMVASAAQSGSAGNMIGTLPGAWLGVVAKLDAAADIQVPAGRRNRIS